MKKLVCESCGSQELISENRVVTCPICGRKYPHIKVEDLGLTEAKKENEIKRLIEVHEAYATKNKSKRTFTFSHIENWNELEHSLEPSSIINFSDEEIIKYAPYSYKADEINAKKGLPKLREQRDLEKFIPSFKLLFVPILFLEWVLWGLYVVAFNLASNNPVGILITRLLPTIIGIGLGCYLSYNIRNKIIWNKNIFLVGILLALPSFIVWIIVFHTFVALGF